LTGPTKGRARREAIISLVPTGRLVVEVGCDHGHTAAALGAIGTERRVHRLPDRRDLRLVVADGLRPFRWVDVAVIAGIGAWQIGRILREGPRPAMAVLHAPDRPAWLRRWCADNGWRIEAERLAPEGRRFAEVMRVVPGLEPHRGQELDFGPMLGADPLVGQHISQLEGYWTRVLAKVHDRSPAKSAEARAWLEFLRAHPRRPSSPDLPPG
jgi:tRNA A22 N-methylase